MPDYSTLSLTDQRVDWLRKLLRAYIPHACIGTPLVLAGAAYIAFVLNLGVSAMWIGAVAAVLAPLPMAMSEMSPYPTKKRPK